MLPIKIDTLKTLLREYVTQHQHTVELILIGGLALQAYGVSDRATVDVDGEIDGELDPLLRRREWPGDIFGRH